MLKISNLIIIGSFAGLWVATLFSSKIELILGFILIFTFGIIHGSNDILLLERLITEKKNRSQARSLIIYILTVLATFLAFYLIPLITLIAFILFSAYHFGEQHWEEKIATNNKWLSTILRMSYGGLILDILFLFNQEEVIEIVSVIASYELTAQFLEVSLISLAILFVASISIQLYKEPTIKKYLLKEIFFLGLLTVIFKMSSLIWGFTIYFVLWHSLPSLYDQVNFIYGSTGKREILAYIENALPYWIISIIGIVISYFWLKDDVLFYAVFFSFIAAVTFPHALIISQMFKKKNISRIV